jgi:putative ABC transport system permease protein
LTALEKPPEPTMYFHYRQFSWRTLALVARAAGDPAALSGTIRAAVAAVDPTQPVFDEHRMSAVVDAAAASPRMNAALLSTFAVLALTLAAIGVYGVMSYTAAQRRPEISLRLALGARPASVFLLVCRTGLRLTVWGLGLGVTGAFVGAAALGSLLFEVSTLQPEIYVAAVSIVLTLAMAACGIPARRAMRSNPNVLLRQD